MGTMGREGGGGGAGNSHTDKHGRARTVGEGRVQKLEVRNSRTAGTASALGERSYIFELLCRANAAGSRPQ